MSETQSPLTELEKEHLQFIFDWLNSNNYKAKMVGGMATGEGTGKDIDLAVKFSGYGNCFYIENAKKRFSDFVNLIDTMFSDGRSYFDEIEYRQPHSNIAGNFKVADSEGSIVLIPKNGRPIEMLPRDRIN